MIFEIMGERGSLEGGRGGKIERSQIPKRPREEGS